MYFYSSDSIMEMEQSNNNLKPFQTTNTISFTPSKESENCKKADVTKMTSFLGLDSTTGSDGEDYRNTVYNLKYFL